METLELDGRRIAYRDEGSGPAVLLIHGVGTPGEVWAEDIAPLAGDHRLIVYDRRGYGGSSESPRDWSAHRDDAAALLEALGAGPALIVGYSGGSIVALDLVLERPDLVAGLLLLDPAFNVKRCITPGLVRAMAAAQLLRRLRGPRHGAARWLRYVTGYHPGSGSAFEKAPHARRERLLANAEGMFCDFASGSGEHVDEARLAGIDVPVTLVDARLSPPFLRRSCGRLRELLPQARTITLAESGHALAVDAPDELLRILRVAAAGVRRSGG